MKQREKSPCQVEFSEERVEVVNDGCQQQRHTYQLQNRGPGSVRVRAAIGADSDPVSTLIPGSITRPSGEVMSTHLSVMTLARRQKLARVA